MSEPSVISKHLRNSEEGNDREIAIGELESSEVDPEVARAEQIKKNQAAIELLRSWREYGDEQEQTETWEYLRQALNEDRLSNRPLFPSNFI